MDPEQSQTETTPAPETPATETPDDGAGLLAAVNAAIDAETPAAAAAAAEPAGETETTEEPGKTEAAAADAGEEKDTPAPADKGAAAATGKGGSKEKGAAAEKGGASKQPDPVNDPIPEDVQGRTRERMQQLISRVKETSGERDRIQRERDDLVGMVAETRASPEQFNDTLQYLAAVNSGDPARIKGAIQTLQREVIALSQMIGEVPPGVDVLANHADLRQAVNAGDLSEAHARELAAARDARAFAQRRTEAQSAEQQQQQELEAGRTALNELEKQLSADPEYARKRAILIPTLQSVFPSVHPSRWAETFKQAYDRLKLGPAPVPTAAASAGASAAATGAGQQPLRARQPAGPAAKSPSSLLEAINAGIEQGSRR